MPGESCCSTIPDEAIPAAGYPWSQGLGRPTHGPVRCVEETITNCILTIQTGVLDHCKCPGSVNVISWICSCQALNKILFDTRP